MAKKKRKMIDDKNIEQAPPLFCLIQLNAFSLSNFSDLAQIPQKFLLCMEAQLPTAGQTGRRPSDPPKLYSASRAATGDKGRGRRPRTPPADNAQFRVNWQPRRPFPCRRERPPALGRTRLVSDGPSAHWRIGASARWGGITPPPPPQTLKCCQV